MLQVVKNQKMQEPKSFNEPDEKGNFKPQTFRIERIVENGELTQKYLFLTQLSNGDYSTSIFDIDSHEYRAYTYSNVYGAAAVEFKRRLFRLNNNDYDSMYGETREDRQQALALYHTRLCYHGRTLEDFDNVYRGSYKDGNQFVFNSIRPVFAKTTLSEIGVNLCDFNLQKIQDRWFDPNNGSHTSISTQKSNQNSFHVYRIPQNPELDSLQRKYAD